MAINILDPVGSIKADLQAYVGRFLQLKARLNPLTTSTDPATAQAASQFMQQQVNLETQLPGMLALANTLSAGSLVSFDTLKLSTFATQLYNHTIQVESFIGPASLVSAQADLLPGLNVTQPQFLIAIGILGAGIFTGKPLIGALGAGGFLLYTKASA